MNARAPVPPDHAFAERSGQYQAAQPRQRSFFFHYNKPASLSAGEPRLSIHFRGACFLAHGVECRVPVQSRNRRTQPRCVMAGKATHVTITPEQIAVIT